MFDTFRVVVIPSLSRVDILYNWVQMLYSSPTISDVSIASAAIACEFTVYSLENTATDGKYFC